MYFIFYHGLVCYTFFFFFFLMIRRPPRSTLFPTRRSSDLQTAGAEQEDGSKRYDVTVTNGARVTVWDVRLDCGYRFRYVRSEEHTSELQSRQYLVCRLLLEKKKKAKLS